MEAFAVIAAVSLVFILILMGCPIFVSLGFGSLIGILLSTGISGLGQIPATIYKQLSSFILVAIPLFVLMGNIVASTGIGTDLYEALNRWLNRVPGGLAISSIGACSLFGALCGVSIAGVATIGPLAMPEMLRRKYDPKLAAGAITAAGALAMLIPPSIAFIIYGAISYVSVGKLFIAGILPGVILSCMMAIYVLIRVIINPQLAPQEYRYVSWGARFRPLVRLWPMLLIVLLVLGSIYLGICSPSEAAGIGVITTLLVAIFIYRSLTLKKLIGILGSSCYASASILIIVAVALVFGNFLSCMNVPEFFAQIVLNLPVPPIIIVIFLMIGLLILGMFIDGVSLILITTPILLPALLKMGFDPLWYGVILVLNIEMAVITPPVGLNLYTMKSIYPDLSLGDIIRGTIPYIGIEFICLLLFIIFPDLVTWLPNLLD